MSIGRPMHVGATFLLVVLSLTGSPLAKRWYVKAGVTGDGSGWADALGSVQAAIDSARLDGGGEVWVGRGRYFPGGDKSDFFMLHRTVQLYGGFEGWETELSQRQRQDMPFDSNTTVDPWDMRNETFLDGNIGDPDTDEDNTLTIVNADDGGYLDGFTIQNARHRAGSATQGGGIRAKMNAEIVNCLIMANVSTRGGGVHLSDGATLRNCLVTHNHAAYGGGVYATAAAIESCLVVHNGCGRQGGGLFVLDSSSVLACMVGYNSSDGNGGGIRAENGCTIDESRIIGNLGGGVGVEGCTVSRCVITDNDGTALTHHSGPGAGGIAAHKSSHVTGCTIARNYTEGRCGGALFTEATVVEACTIDSNESGGDWGGCRLDGSRMRSCSITGNRAGRNGGGLAVSHDDRAQPALVNCVITGNVAARDGSGIHVTGRSTGHIINCLIAGNSAGADGGGIIAKGWFINCTIAQNEAERYGAFDGYGNTTRWVNCIEWANGTDPFRTGACEIRHCCFSEEIEFDDTHFGNFTADPLFVDADGGDYRLSAASPCIDTGITETTDLFLPEYDLSGETERILNGRIDCGAYEFAGTADVDNRYHRNHPRTSPVWMGGLHRENMDLFDLRGRAVAPVSISRRQAARGWYVLTPANGRSRGSERQIVTGLCR